MAGLLACGSPPAPNLPSFPVVLRGVQARRLQLRGQPRLCRLAPSERTLFPFHPSLEGTIAEGIIANDVAMRKSARGACQNFARASGCVCASCSTVCPSQRPKCSSRSRASNRNGMPRRSESTCAKSPQRRSGELMMPSQEAAPTAAAICRHPRRLKGSSVLPRKQALPSTSPWRNRSITVVP
jgi:hypothetical protein